MENGGLYERFAGVTDEIGKKWSKTNQRVREFLASLFPAIFDQPRRGSTFVPGPATCQTWSNGFQPWVGLVVIARFADFLLAAAFYCIVFAPRPTYCPGLMSTICAADRC